MDVADAVPTGEQVAYLLKLIPPDEADLSARNWGKMKLDKVAEPKTAKDKIALFCALYKSYRAIPYITTQTERANIIHVPVSEALLAVFFETTLQDYTLRNYSARINITRDILANGRDFKSRFPNYFDPEFYRKLEGQKLVDYQRHLRLLGWRSDPRKGWVKDPQ
ncbi:MAG: hypothetical protein V4621_08255 [Pseudomonadota bacterium]